MPKVSTDLRTLVLKRNHSKKIAKNQKSKLRSIILKKMENNKSEIKTSKGGKKSKSKTKKRRRRSTRH